MTYFAVSMFIRTGFTTNNKGNQIEVFSSLSCIRNWKMGHPMLTTWLHEVFSQVPCISLVAIPEVQSLSPWSEAAAKTPSFTSMQCDGGRNGNVLESSQKFSKTRHPFHQPELSHMATLTLWIAENTVGWTATQPVKSLGSGLNGYWKKLDIFEILMYSHSKL